MFFIHSSINGLLGSFHILTTMNNAATNVEVQTFLDLSLNSLGYSLSSKVAGPYGSSNIKILKHLYTVFHSSSTLLYFTSNAQGFNFSTISSTLVILGFVSVL
jgi:hypothetical protein